MMAGEMPPGREAETDEDGRDTESDGYTAEPIAEPGTRPDVLWCFPSVGHI